MAQKLTILHVVGGGLSNGAAKGAITLHQELNRRGQVKSLVLSNSLDSSARVEKLRLARLNWLFDKVKRRVMNVLFRPKGYFSTDFGGGNIPDVMVSSADIVHIHTFSNSIINLNQISKLNVPVVVTLRDMWTMTGGCHYSIDCFGFQTSCSSCPLSSSAALGAITRSQLAKKARVFNSNGRVTFVGISSWIVNQAQKSSALGDKAIQYIPNQIDFDKFTISGEIGRDEFGLKESGPVVLVGGVNLMNEYKGLKLLLGALVQLNERVNIVFFGSTLELDELEEFHNVVQLGPILDQERLMRLYNCADVFVSSSVQEAFGKTMVEALACGTPVVAFVNSGGADDILEHKKNGFLAKYRSEVDLARGIEWVLRNEFDGDLLRESVHSRFSSAAVADAYIRLYQNLTV